MAENLTFYIKRGDTTKKFRARILDGSDPVDLTTAATVKLKVKDPAGTLVINANMTIENQTTNEGWVNHSWVAGQTDTTGTHKAEIEITWGDGTKDTYPPDRYAFIQVVPDLG